MELRIAKPEHDAQRAREVWHEHRQDFTLAFVEGLRTRGLEERTGRCGVVAFAVGEHDTAEYMEDVHAHEKLPIPPRLEQLRVGDQIASQNDSAFPHEPPLGEASRPEILREISRLPQLDVILR